MFFFDHTHTHTHTISLSLSLSLSLSPPEVFVLLIDLMNSNEDSGSCQQNISQIGPEEPERKRRPGRPRGSKNRKPRVGSSRHEGLYYQGQPSVGPPHLSDINPQNHQYFEFQWRVLNLCAEFYGAAEELVVSRNQYFFLSLEQVYVHSLLISLCRKQRPRW